MFIGGDGKGKAGFNIAEMSSALGVDNQNLIGALANRIARPNDLGFKDLDLKTEETAKAKSEPKPKRKFTKTGEKVK